MHVRISVAHALLAFLVVLMVNVYLYTSCLSSFLKENDKRSLSTHTGKYERGGGSLRKDNEPVLQLLNNIIIVLTGPSNTRPRSAIRHTWKTKLPPNCKLFFIVGTMGVSQKVEETLLKEQDSYKDLIIFNDLMDSYNNLTEKLLMSIVYFSTYYKFKHFVKVDDDVYVNVNALLENLSSLPEDDPVYYGYFAGDARVKSTGPWAEPNYHLCDRYLPYARGGGYAISHHLAQFISRSNKDLQLYNSEDVSLGIWLAPTKHTKKHDVRFDTEALSRGCQNDFIITHKVDPESMASIHDHLTTTGRLCKEEFKLKAAYEYRFDVPPSKCCNKI